MNVYDIRLVSWSFHPFTPAVHLSFLCIQGTMKDPPSHHGYDASATTAHVVTRHHIFQSWHSPEASAEKQTPVCPEQRTVSTSMALLVKLQNGCLQLVPQVLIHPHSDKSFTQASTGPGSKSQPGFKAQRRAFHLEIHEALPPIHGQSIRHVHPSPRKSSRMEYINTSFLGGESHDSPPPSK